MTSLPRKEEKRREIVEDPYMIKEKVRQKLTTLRNFQIKNFGRDMSSQNIGYCSRRKYYLFAENVLSTFENRDEAVMYIDSVIGKVVLNKENSNMLYAIKKYFNVEFKTNIIPENYKEYLYYSVEKNRLDLVKDALILNNNSGKDIRILQAEIGEAYVIAKGKNFSEIYEYLYSLFDDNTTSIEFLAMGAAAAGEEKELQNYFYPAIIGPTIESLETKYPEEYNSTALIKAKDQASVVYHCAMKAVDYGRLNILQILEGNQYMFSGWKLLQLNNLRYFDCSVNCVKFLLEKGIPPRKILRYLSVHSNLSSLLYMYQTYNIEEYISPLAEVIYRNGISEEKVPLNFLSEKASNILRLWGNLSISHVKGLKDHIDYMVDLRNNFSLLSISDDIKLLELFNVYPDLKESWSGLFEKRRANTLRYCLKYYLFKPKTATQVIDKFIYWIHTNEDVYMYEYFQKYISTVDYTFANLPFDNIRNYAYFYAVYNHELEREKLYQTFKNVIYSKEPDWLIIDYIFSFDSPEFIFIAEEFEEIFLKIKSPFVKLKFLEYCIYAYNISFTNILRNSTISSYIDHHYNIFRQFISRKHRLMSRTSAGRFMTSNLYDPNLKTLIKQYRYKNKEWKQGQDVTEEVCKDIKQDYHQGKYSINAYFSNPYVKIDWNKIINCILDYQPELYEYFEYSIGNTVAKHRLLAAVKKMDIKEVDMVLETNFKIGDAKDLYIDIDINRAIAKSQDFWFIGDMVNRGFLQGEMAIYIYYSSIENIENYLATYCQKRGNRYNIPGNNGLILDIIQDQYKNNVEEKLLIEKFKNFILLSAVSYIPWLIESPSSCDIMNSSLYGTSVFYISQYLYLIHGKVYDRPFLLLENPMQIPSNIDDFEEYYYNITKKVEGYTKDQIIYYLNLKIKKYLEETKVENYFEAINPVMYANDEKERENVLTFNYSDILPVINSDYKQPYNRSHIKYAIYRAGKDNNEEMFAFYITKILQDEDTLKKIIYACGVSGNINFVNYVLRLNVLDYNRKIKLLCQAAARSNNYNLFLLFYSLYFIEEKEEYSDASQVKDERILKFFMNKGIYPSAEAMIHLMLSDGRDIVYRIMKTIREKNEEKCIEIMNQIMGRFDINESLVEYVLYDSMHQPLQDQDSYENWSHIFRSIGLL